MAGPHRTDTNAFHELSFAERSRSIAAAIDDLQAAIEHHVAHSPRRPETIETCLSQVDRLGRRLRETYEQRGARSGSGRAILPGVEQVPRLRVGSPRLAEPERAADFTMDVAEEAQDAGLR